MIEALIAGERDAAQMADLAQKRLRNKIPQLTEAMVGRFNDHHAFLARVHLNLIDQHTAVIDQLTERLEAMMEQFRGFRDLICTIPGISARTADIVVAETGADMSQFPTAKHLASWAGTTPGNNESAGRVKSTRTRPGNSHLQGALGASAMSIARTPGTYLNSKYRRIAARRGPQKANVAVQHALLVAIWHMGTTGTLYEDPGADYYNRLRPERARQRAVHQLQRESSGFGGCRSGTTKRTTTGSGALASEPASVSALVLGDVHDLPLLAGTVGRRQRLTLNSRNLIRAGVTAPRTDLDVLSGGGRRGSRLDVGGHAGSPICPTSGALRERQHGREHGHRAASRLPHGGQRP